MWLLRLVVSALLVAALAGCGQDDGGDRGGTSGGAGSGGGAGGSGGAGSGSGGGTGAPTPVSYKVLDSDCPQGWTGLTVTTDSDAEAEYLDDMPACTNADHNTTYLENGSDAVWVLRSTSRASGTTTPIELTLSEKSFVEAVTDRYPGQAIFVPGAKLTVNLAPEEVEWVVDLSLSFGWQAHDLVVDKIKGAGKEAALAALERRSPAGNALAVCTLAVTDYAKTVPSLEKADAVNVLMDGLGLGVSVNKCRSESASVGAVDEAGRSVTLADDLAHLRSQTKILESVHGKLDYAQRAWKAIELGLKFRW